MNLTKNQIYIISAVIIVAIVYFVFFKKKAPAVVVVPPPAKPESGYFGEDWGWGTGPQEITPEMAMRSMSGPAGNSVAGTMESGFNVQDGMANNHRPKNPWQVTPESNYGGAYGRGMKGGARESAFGGAGNDNWLGY